VGESKATHRARAMSTILTDKTIDELITAKKWCSGSKFQSIKYPKQIINGDLRTEIRVHSDAPVRMIVACRKSSVRPNGFTIRLAFLRSSRQFNLLRCNGYHAEHTNHLERTKFPKDTFHIHKMTERYQRHAIYAPDEYAEETSEYSSFEEACDYFARRVNLHDRLFRDQLELFSR
jgi:hypothetical protein